MVIINVMQDTIDNSNLQNHYHWMKTPFKANEKNVFEEIFKNMNKRTRTIIIFNDSRSDEYIEVMTI